MKYVTTGFIAVFCCIILIGCVKPESGKILTESASETDPGGDLINTPENTGSGENSINASEESAPEEKEPSSAASRHKRIILPSDTIRDKDDPGRDKQDPSSSGTSVEKKSPEPPAPEGNDQKNRSWETNKEFFEVTSGFYRKLNQKQDVNVLVNGDSIGAGSGATKGNSWTDLLKNYIESEYQVSCNMTNISMGGNESYAGYVMENILDDGINYDLMLICYGQNDNEAALSPEYEAMIRAAKRKYPSVNIISVLESSQRDYTKKMGDIDALAEYYDIQIADTISAFNESGRPYEELTVDALHPNDDGYRLYFEAVKKVIERETESDTGVENIERKPILPEVSGYDSFRYFPAEQFVRKTGTSYELALNDNVRGIIGLRHVLCPVNGEIIIYTDGVESLRRPLVWDLNFKKDYIYKADNSVHSASHSIEIHFPTVETADGFKGLIFTGG